MKFEDKQEHGQIEVYGTYVSGYAGHPVAYASDIMTKAGDSVDDALSNIATVESAAVDDDGVITLTLSNGHTVTIEGSVKGPQGESGGPGEPGNGISSISKTKTDGIVDTYTITFTNNQTTTFTVTNGKDGGVLVSQYEDVLASENEKWTEISKGSYAIKLERTYPVLEVFAVSSGKRQEILTAKYIDEDYIYLEVGKKQDCVIRKFLGGNGGEGGNGGGLTIGEVKAELQPTVDKVNALDSSVGGLTEWKNTIGILLPKISLNEEKIANVSATTNIHTKDITKLKTDTQTLTTEVQTLGAMDSTLSQRISNNSTQIANLRSRILDADRNIVPIDEIKSIAQNAISSALGDVDIKGIDKRFETVNENINRIDDTATDNERELAAVKKTLYGYSDEHNEYVNGIEADVKALKEGTTSGDENVITRQVLYNMINNGDGIATAGNDNSASKFNSISARFHSARIFESLSGLDNQAIKGYIDIPVEEWHNQNNNNIKRLGAKKLRIQWGYARATESDTTLDITYYYDMKSVYGVFATCVQTNKNKVYSTYGMAIVPESPTYDENGKYIAPKGFRACFDGNKIWAVNYLCIGEAPDE